MDEHDLLKLKEEIEDAKTQVAELKGKEKYLKQELQDKWDCETIEEAEKILSQMEKDAEKIDKQIQKATTQIKDKYVKKEL